MEILGWRIECCYFYRVANSSFSDKVPLDRDIKSEGASYDDMERKNILEKACLVQFRKNREADVIKTVRENESGRRRCQREEGCLSHVT